MSRTIKRGTPARRSARKVVKPSFSRRIMARVPLSQETVAKIVAWTILGGAGIGLAAAASWAGVPAMVGTAIAEGAGRAGLRVEQVEVTGLSRMDRMSVYAVALEQQSRALALVDLNAVRQKLLRYGWVADAEVSRRFPDTLLVHVVERKPAAVWQDGGQLTLIDEQGVLLEPVSPDRMPDLPLVIGPGADRQEGNYTALLAAAPDLKRQVVSAAWVGNRRWDLTFRSGEVLALPEDGAREALMRFARLEREGPLLDRGWKRFDMRDPSRLVARKPGANERALMGAVVPEAGKVPTGGMTVGGGTVDGGTPAGDDAGKIGERPAASGTSRGEV